MSSSSDRTKKLSSRTRYNELSTNIRFHNTLTPVKKDGSKYEMFGVTRYNKSSQVRNSINTFNSYAERLELKKGKQYTNTPINGIDNLKYDMKAGNLMQIKYNNTIPLIATGNLDISGEKLMSPDGKNLIPYPSNTVDYPGFIIDPNNEIFKKIGVGIIENQQQNWIRNLSTTEFNDSNQWNKLNKSQDLQNFTLTGGVNLWSEFNINVTAITGAYVMNGIHRKGNLINEQNPTLYFDPYDTINFVIDASGTNPTGEIHKFRINTTNYKSDSDDYIVSDYFVYDSTGQILQTSSGIAKGTITWTPKRKGRFFYNCHQHGKMHGIIIIGDGSIKYPVVEQIIKDEIAPVITADNTQDLSGNNTKPSYEFTSNEAGTITITPSTYSVTPTSVIEGVNNIVFDNIAQGTHDISFTVTDINGNISLPHVIPRFTIDTTRPQIDELNFDDMSGTDITPEFTFRSNKAGTINIIPNTYSVTPTSVIADSNTITFDSLPGGIYDSLSFRVIDIYDNITTTEIDEFTITSNVNETAITSSSQVNVIVSNGNKYVFNGENSYNPATIYTLTQGSYTFTNIPEAHPMAILNNNISNITYNASSNANNPIIIKVSGGSMSPNNNGDYYTFKNSNDAVINIANGGFKFMRGKTYRFDDVGLTTTTTTQSSGYSGTTTTTTITHPLKIITLANNNTVTNTLNTVGGSITVTIPQDASTTSGDLYYQCSNHTDMIGNLSLLYKQVTNSTADGFYDFYYGNMDVSVTGDFDTVSVYCYHHGYMGGENLLKYIQ